MELAPKSKTTKLFKVLGIVLGIGAVLFVIFIAVVFYYLPSAKQIGSFFKKDKQAQSQLAKNKSIQATSSVDKTLIDHVDTSTVDNSSTKELSNESFDKVNEFEKLKEFIDEKTPAMIFCSKLNQAKTGPLNILTAKTHKEVKNRDGTKTQVNTTFDTKDLGDDLRLEAIKPFFKTVLKQPEMQKLIAMLIQDDSFKKNQDAASEGLFDKAIFYKQAYSAYSEMKQNLPEYESIVDRSYLMYKLNDLIVFKPELQNDPRIMKFCEESEYQSNSYAQVDFGNEKQVFERLIQELDVDPKAIKYDPEYKTTLKLDFSGNNLQIGGGWLNELMPKDPSSVK